MKLHEIKIQKKFYLDVTRGDKTFELRKDDRGYEVGDLINFTVVSESSEPMFSGDMYRIIYKLENYQGLQKGYCILGIERVEIVTKRDRNPRSTYEM